MSYAAYINSNGEEIVYEHDDDGTIIVTDWDSEFHQHIVLETE